MKVEETENIRIAQFLSATSDFIKGAVRKILMMAGCKIVEQGNGLNSCYEIRYKDNKACLFFRNLYLEIATKDRDVEPLEFDERLRDYEYFLSKTSHVIKSKLEILLKFLRSTDTEKTIDDIFKEFSGERIIIEKVDRANG